MVHQNIPSVYHFHEAFCSLASLRLMRMRADQSAVCAINRHLQWVEDPHRGCPGYFVHVHYAIGLLSWVTLGLSPTRIPNPSPVAFAAKPGRRDETDRAR